MLSYSLRTTSAPRPRLDSNVPFDRCVVPRTATSRFADDYSRFDEEQVPRVRPRSLPDFPARDIIDPAVDIFPSDAVKRHALAWDGMGIEVVQALTHETIEFRFCASRHSRCQTHRCRRMWSVWRSPRQSVCLSIVRVQQRRTFASLNQMLR